MSYYVKQYLFHLKDCYEKYFLSITDDKAAVIKAMNSFRFPDNPSVNHLDDIRAKFFDHIKRELPTLFPISNVVDFKTKANQLRVK